MFSHWFAHFKVCSHKFGHYVVNNIEGLIIIKWKACVALCVSRIIGRSKRILNENTPHKWCQRKRCSLLAVCCFGLSR